VVSPSADIPEVREFFSAIANASAFEPLSRKQVFSPAMLDRAVTRAPSAHTPSLEEFKTGALKGKLGVLMTDGGTVQETKFQNYLWQSQDGTLVHLRTIALEDTAGTGQNLANVLEAVLVDVEIRGGDVWALCVTMPALS
jgi:hypothetical protein